MKRSKPRKVKAVVLIQKGNGQPSGIWSYGGELRRGDALLCMFPEAPRRNGIYKVSSVDVGKEVIPMGCGKGGKKTGGKRP